MPSATKTLFEKRVLDSFCSLNNWQSCMMDEIQFQAENQQQA